ncbi:MAG: macro domain-containing protein [Oscillospiraceae bacterium]|nr:macro domain-containing protein [Oscillospiraceae bacterium]
MAFTIVRNDIVRMEVDAIVNSTNERFRVGGVGVDAGIRHAAGPGLDEALAKIGSCPAGSAVITGAYGIPTCRYIIHTVGPIYRDGRHGEEELLRSCYRSILSLARESGCRSVAIPSISSGAYAYPKKDAYRIATACIREFLFSLPDDEDMMIYLVLFDQASVELGSKIDGGIQEQISPAYPKAKKARLGSLFQLHNVSAPQNRRDEEPVDAVFGSMPAELDSSEAYPLSAAAFEADAASPLVEEQEPEVYAQQDLSFAEMCEWWCEQKGLSKKEFYICSNINKSMFWNMKHHPDQTPRKTNVLACAIGLQLDYHETQDLLMRAGMTLSRYYALDRAVEGFIRSGNYNIYEINENLFEQDLPLLGAY